jgi:hypothetical protein
MVEISQPRRPSAAAHGRAAFVWWLRLAGLIGAAALLLWAATGGWPPPVRATTISQTRANTLLPSPQADSQIRQTFTPPHNGLVEIELLAGRHVETPSGALLSVVLLDGAGQPVAAEQFPSDSLAHNQPVTLRFPIQRASAGQTYTLLVGGSDGNNVSVWGYDQDVHAGGGAQITGAESSARELRFVARYELRAAAAVLLALRRLGESAGLIALAIAFLFLPGCLALLVLWRRPMGNAAAWLGAALALGLAIWPLLWLWLTTLGGRWRPWSLGAVLIAGWLAVAVLAWRRWRATGGTVARPRHAGHYLALLLLLAVGLGARLLAGRDLAFPPWVDASRHALITAVMVNSGQILRDYGPYLPISDFPYHDGFHALSATLMLLAGAELPDVLLSLGHLLNALAPLTIYAGAYLLTRRRDGALLAAFLVGLPFFLPAYYVTWGRYTQLSGVVILPVALGLTWQIGRGGRGWRRAWPLLGVLVAGLFLLHLRVLLLYVAFAGLAWLASRGRHTRWLLAAAGLSIAAAFPAIVRLAADASIPSLGVSIPGYNDFPAGYVTTGWERPLLALGGVAVIAALFGALRRRAWAAAPLVLALWVALAGLLLAGRRVGLPETWLINLNSAYITLFVPLALAIGLAAGRLWRWLRRRPQAVRLAAAGLTGAAVTAAGLFGAYQQITIVNTETILAEPADAAGLAWLAANAPDGTKIAVNSWRWLGTTWSGSDGGAWIVPLTGLTTTTPPADYIYDPTLAAEVDAFNEAASGRADWADAATAAWLADQGVSLVYVGPRGGFFDPAVLARNPGLVLRYAQDGVFIFAVRAAAAAHDAQRYLVCTAPVARL